MLAIYDKHKFAGDSIAYEKYPQTNYRHPTRESLINIEQNSYVLLTFKSRSNHITRKHYPFSLNFMIFFTTLNNKY